MTSGRFPVLDRAAKVFGDGLEDPPKHALFPASDLEDDRLSSFISVGKLILLTSMWDITLPFRLSRSLAMSLVHGTAVASRKMAVADLLEYSRPMHDSLQPACKAAAEWKAAQQQPSLNIEHLERMGDEFKLAVAECDMEGLNCPCEVQHSDDVLACIVW